MVSNDVLTLAASGNSVWVGTPSGMSAFTPSTNTWTTYTTSSGQPSNTVNAAHIAPISL